MKKILLSFSCALLLTTALFAQDSTRTVRRRPVIDQNRANDHFLLQLGLTNWAGKPDSIQTSGFSHSFNVYFMFDFPFKTNPHLSMAFGPGIASDHIILKKTYVGIKENSSILQFTDQSDTTHFKKTKLVTAWLEAPVEFRYNSDPSGLGFKFAFGAKVGTLINVHTRNKDLQDKNNTALNSYTMKESSKRFFNGNRLSLMARIGYGHFTVFGTYQVTTLLKEGKGADMRPYSIGLTLSGL
jgi:hypothetical protein